MNNFTIIAHTNPNPNQQTFWQPLALGTIKLNFDTTFHSSSRGSILDIIARDEMGQIMGAYTYPHVAVADAFVIEAKACEHVVCFVINIGFRRVQFEGDSLIVIKKLVSCTMDHLILSPIITDNKQRLGFFIEATFLHTRRDTNAAAYALAWEGRLLWRNTTG
ncbi:hypothetical protein Gotur_003087 [Gossypium turneri]